VEPPDVVKGFAGVKEPSATLFLRRDGMENPEAFCLHLKDMVKQVASTVLLGISQSSLQALPLLLGPQLSFPRGNHTRKHVDA